MKTWKTVCSLIAAPLVVCAATAPAAILAQEDFEAGSGMSVRQNNDGSVGVIADPTDAGNQVAYLETLDAGSLPSNGDARLFANEWFAATPLVTLSFDVYFADSLGQIADNANTHNDGIFVRFGTFRADGFIAPDPVVYVTDFQNATNSSGTVKFTPGQWHRVDIVALGHSAVATNYTVPGSIARTLNPHNCHIYIDGKFAKNSGASNGASTGDITSVGIETINNHGTGNRADLYVDNLVVRDEICVGSLPVAAGFTTLSCPPVDDVIESYDASAHTNDLATFGPSRLTDTPTLNQENRVVGQTFTVTGTNSYILDALTLRITNNKSFDSAAHTLTLALLEDTDSDGKGDAQIGATYAYDVSGLSFSKDQYLTLPLGDGISNLVAGTYQFETYFGETSAANIGLNLERTVSNNYYAAGGQVAKFQNDGTFPVGAGVDAPSTEADFTFFLQGHLPPPPPVFGTFSTGTSAPAAGILESFEAAAQNSFSVTRLTDTPVSNIQNRVLGQTFTVSGVASTETVRAVTIIKASTLDPVAYTNASHTYQLALLVDTDSDGKGDLQMGDTYNFDFTGQTFDTNQFYVTFDLGAGIDGFSNGTYQLEFYWGEVDPLNQGFAMHRSTSNNQYAAGGQVAKFQNDGRFPVGAGVGAPSTQADFTFYILTTNAVPSDPYDTWAGDFGLTGGDAARDADPEPDGVINIIEYALGGNPNIDDAAAILPTAELVDNTGTHWLEYVHTRRQDYVARGLQYHVESTGDLMAPAWTNDSTIVFIGAGAIDAEFDAVTNHLSTAADNYNIRLRIEED